MLTQDMEKDWMKSRGIKAQGWTEQEKKWIEDRQKLYYPAACVRILESQWSLNQEDCECCFYYTRQVCFCPLSPNYKDAAEFEARVAVEAINLSSADVPCAHGMQSFWETSCPLRTTKIYKDGKLVDFQEEGCGEWCLLRMARIEVERDMEAE